MRKQPQRSGADPDLHTGSFSDFKAVFLPGLSVAFFGMGLMRLWYQYNFYNLHFSADYGHVTVGANIVRVGVIALLLFLSYRTQFSHGTKSLFVWSGLVLMTLSGVFYLVDLFFGTVTFEVARFVIGGMGLVGGEIIWVFFFAKAQARRSLPLRCRRIGAFVLAVAGSRLPECRSRRHTQPVHTCPFGDRLLAIDGGFG